MSKRQLAQAGVLRVLRHIMQVSGVSRVTRLDAGKKIFHDINM